MSGLLGMTLSGRYRLEARIGSGGMATVYRAVDETLERDVAVKVMDREVAQDSEQLERFRREARAVAQLSHANVVGVIDAGDDRDHPYIVFEYVDGETLKQRIRRLGQLPIQEAVAYAIEIARALGAAHAHHIVHRDVKPQNVLIDDQGTVKVTDFGIARTLEEQGLTDDGRVLGTTDYVSPEQALGQRVTVQSDLYSLGIVLYEMLTGELPFSGETQVAVAMKHVREQLPDVRAKRPEASAALAAIVETATAKRLADRYGDDRELIADLEELLALETQRAGSISDEVTTVMRTLPRRTRRRVPLGVRHRRLALLLSGLALVAAAAVVVWLGLRTHPGSAHNPAAKGTRAVRVALCGSCATAYNPDGHPGIAQNGNEAHFAIDGDPATAWDTEHYFDYTLGKPGVGIYVNAGSEVPASQIVIETITPGFIAKVYGARNRPDLESFATSGWRALSGSVRIAGDARIHLRATRAAGSAGDRYFLLWITQLPPGRDYAAVNEIELYRR